MHMHKSFCLLIVALLFLNLSNLGQANAQENDLTQGMALKYVSLREKTDTNSSLLRYLKTNEVFEIVQKVNPYWFKVKDYSGRVGYVTSNSAYIKVIANAKVMQNVSLHEQPNYGSRILKQLKVGERMLILEKMNDIWYKVKDSENLLGYIDSYEKSILADTSIIKIIRPVQEQIELTIQKGYQYWGTPYEFRSERLNTSSFDCSDFLQQIVWDTSSLVLPSDSKNQGNYIKNKGNYTTDMSKLKRGDLVFFMTYLGWSSSLYSGIDKMTQTITHAGIYIGDGKMLNTRSVISGGVRIDNLYDGVWRYRFMYGGSIW